MFTGQSKLGLLFASNGASSVQEQLALKSAILKTFGRSSEAVSITFDDFTKILDAYSREVHRGKDPGTPKHLDVCCWHENRVVVFISFRSCYSGKAMRHIVAVNTARILCTQLRAVC